MLVLSRKRHERLIIDERIVVTVVQIHPSRVRLGIDAPPDVSIRREELPALGRRLHAAETRLRELGVDPLSLIPDAGPQETHA